ncbi:MAG: ybeY [Bacteroidetes bacterium]|jgi:rRNA maturation RNase YbeY|nr:ybeY [Bacteroidota bacterium]
MPVHFSNNEISFNLKQKTKLKAWVRQVVEKEKLSTGNIAYVFCSDEALLKINRDFLSHDTYTDIITFDYREDKMINGEIYISVDRVKENAEKFKTTFDNELHRVMIHGVLHICGYKDKGKAATELMRKKEDGALKLLKI